MPRVLFKPTGRVHEVPERTHAKLRIYKTFWPGNTTIKLGKKVVTMDDIDPWPPAEQQGLTLK